MQEERRKQGTVGPPDRADSRGPRKSRRQKETPLRLWPTRGGAALF